MERQPLSTWQQSKLSGKGSQNSLQNIPRRISRILMRVDCLNCKQSYHSKIHSTDMPCSAPPDCGLASKQMSGKKSNKFCITVTFACNADGSERLPIFYIGKSKRPWCFGRRKTPADYGFYYCNNKTAWMTSNYFEECVSSASLVVSVCSLCPCKMDQITGSALQTSKPTHSHDA